MKYTNEELLDYAPIAEFVIVYITNASQSSMNSALTYVHNHKQIQVIFCDCFKADTGGEKTEIHQYRDSRARI